MFETMRKIFGPIAVSVIIGAVALVFVFSGVFNPDGTGGMGAGAMAANVNGDAISLQEFSREYQQRVDFYSNMMKGKADPKLLAQMGLKQQVLEDMIRRKLMLQEARKMGLRVSDEEVREKIAEMPYFKSKDGKFDSARYNQLLTANNYSPATFEDTVRDDQLRGHLVEFLRARTRVSDKEVENEFLASEDKRQVNYVFVSRDEVRKKIVVSDKEIADFLKNDANVGAAKTYYEQNKFAYMKLPAKAQKKDTKKIADKPEADKPEEEPKPEFHPFDEVKQKVAAEILKDRRTEEVAKATKAIADELVAKAKSGDAQLKSLAKSKGLEVKTTEKFNRLQGAIPGIGEVPDLLADAFKEPSPLVQAPKLYETRGSFILAHDLKSFKPNLADLSKDKDKLVQQVTAKKEQAMYEQWMGSLRQQAKVSINKAVERKDEESAVD